MRIFGRMLSTCEFIHLTEQNETTPVDKEEIKEDEDGQLVINHIMRCSLLNIKKHHPLFLNLGTDTCKEMLSQMPLIILEDSQLLYKEGEELTNNS